MAMPRATTAWLGSPVIASPSKVIEPPAGATTPAMARSAEVLPAPFEPMMPTNSPRAHFEIDAAHRFDAAIGDLEAFDLEQRIARVGRVAHHFAATACWRANSAPPVPK